LMDIGYEVISKWSIIRMIYNYVVIKECNENIWGQETQERSSEEIFGNNKILF
jgi:hypothetical protein